MGLEEHDRWVNDDRIYFRINYSLTNSVTQQTITIYTFSNIASYNNPSAMIKLLSLYTQYVSEQMVLHA